MARLESQAKAGFYPTPPEVVEAVAKLIELNGGQIYLLDPCCGDGRALFLLKRKLLEYNRGTVIVTYGIELNKDRAREAKRALGRVIRGDAFNTVIQRGG